MGKILAGIMTMFMLFIITIYAILGALTSNQQSFLNSYVDGIGNGVQLSGRLSEEQYNRFVTNIRKIGQFTNQNGIKAITLRKGKYVDGYITNVSDYNVMANGGLGEQLYKGDAFIIYIKDSKPTVFSRAYNLGVSEDDSKNSYFWAKRTIRVEYVD